MACHGVNGLVIASPGVDIVRTLAPNHGDLGPGQRRFQFDYDSAGNVVLQLQSLGPRSLELAGPENAPRRGFDKLRRNADSVTCAS